MGEALPRQFGSYTLVRRIATGGMAELFLARRTGPAGTEKQLAIKRILPSLATDEAFVAMFLNEARLAALLNHASVVRTYDLGRVEGTLYLAMEYVDGVDLRTIGRMLRRMKRQLPFPIAAVLGARVAEALDYAHRLKAPGGASLGLVHRDVSPDNMLLTRDGHVKLADFGIAKALASHPLTRTHGFKGKANYVSPEQILSEPLDGRADLFSLGTSLYLLTTGRFPFAATSDFLILEQVLHTEPAAPSSLAPGYPPELERIVARLLAKRPADRYGDAGEAATALLRFARDAGASLTPRELADFLVLTEEQDRLFRLANPNVPLLTTEIPAQGPPPLVVPPAGGGGTAQTVPDLAPTKFERGAPAAQTVLLDTVVRDRRALGDGLQPPTDPQTVPPEGQAAAASAATSDEPTVMPFVSPTDPDLEVTKVETSQEPGPASEPAIVVGSLAMGRRRASVLVLVLALAAVVVVVVVGSVTRRAAEEPATDSRRSIDGDAGR